MECIKKRKKLQQNRCSSISSFLRLFTEQKKRKDRIILQQLISDVLVNRNTPTRARQRSRLNFCHVTDSFARKFNLVPKIPHPENEVTALRHFMKFVAGKTMGLTICCLVNRNLKMTLKIERKRLWIEKIIRRVFWPFKAVFFLSLYLKT